MELAPPTYTSLTFSEAPYVPVYSQCPDTSERVLDYLPCSHLHLVPSGGSDFIYKTDHMVVNLGPRIWSESKPVYGLKGTITGHVKLSGDQSHVDKVTVTLKGLTTTTTADRGMVSSHSSVPLFQQMTTLYTSTLKEGFRWNEDHAFSLPFPAEANINRGGLPPSFNTYLHGTTCEVKYFVKFDMAKKGLRRHQSLTIPVLYFPKSRPSQPPLSILPRSTRHVEEVPYPIDDRVKTIRISPNPSSPEFFMFLSLPSPTSFTSGEEIPLMLCFAFPDAAALVKDFLPKIHVELIKKTRVWRNSAREYVSKAVTVSTPKELRRMVENTRNVVRMTCRLQAGEAGRECSWGLDDIVDIRYSIRVVLTSPDTEKIPSFRHEEPVQITTDLWGAYERELISTGGTPTPALGLMSSQQSPTQTRTSSSPL